MTLPPPVTDPALGALVERLATLRELELAARRAPDEAALAFTAVNDSHRLLPYHWAAWCRPGRDGRLQVRALSGLAAVEREAPLVQALEAVLADRELAAADAPRLLPAGTLASDPDLQALWLPLRAPHGRHRLGGLWLARPEAWPPAAQTLLAELAECHAHALQALSARPPRRSLRRRSLVTLTVLALLALGFVPVRLSVLAPAEVVARRPLPVAAPIDGVIERFLVQPNEAVEAGAPLFEFDTTTLRARLEVAGRAVAVAAAEHQRAVQKAFADAASRAEVALLAAKLDESRASRDAVAVQLERSRVSAAQAGVAVYTDPDDWLGRPVATGEKILTLADAADTELAVQVPVDDALILGPGAEVQLFLNTDPLAPLGARLTRSAYEPQPTPEGTLAYPSRAAFDAGTPLPRLGLKGTARVYGEPVTLAYYLLRRPLAALRRWIGL